MPQVVQAEACVNVRCFLKPAPDAVYRRQIWFAPARGGEDVGLRAAVLSQFQNARCGLAELNPSGSCLCQTELQVVVVHIRPSQPQDFTRPAARQQAQVDRLRRIKRVGFGRS